MNLYGIKVSPLVSLFYDHQVIQTDRVDAAIIPISQAIANQRAPVF